MLALVTFTVPEPSVVASAAAALEQGDNASVSLVRKARFWTSVEARKTGNSPAALLPPGSADHYDNLFRTKFPEALERLLNADEKRVLHRGRSTKKPGRISVRLQAADYGTLKAFLEIFGIEGKDLLALLISALRVYSPLAFRDAIGVDAEADPEILGDGDPPQRGVAALMAELSNPVLLRTLTSFALPILIALFLAYEAFIKWTDVHAQMRAEAADFRKERAGIVEALAKQNEALSKSLVEAAKGSHAKAMEDALASYLKKLLDRLTTSDKDDGELKALKADIQKLGQRLERLEKPIPTPPPTVWLPVNCENRLQSPDCALIQFVLHRRVGRPVNDRNQAWIDGYGGPATFGAIHVFLDSIGAPRLDYLSAAQLQQLIYNAAPPQR